MAQGRDVMTPISVEECQSQWPQQMTGGVDRIALGALLDEELPGDEQCSDENEREHGGRELTGIIHRTRFSQFGSHGERRPTIASSCAVQIICLFFPDS
ncbi:hypothetical protein [Bradyrhizobium guangzhouense]|uniref:hypothetical protein n=1 Tax=Bradyrhizobium guangzhouense TaxID=1325095 RepID=UPI0013E8B3FC|nr:hypothetical protein [Bradyrhizobium guangzhouense]